jgi:DNA-binding winged helix-turn-helix (wHTH) protein/tetratricopeptide (TPR) repeat protein
MGRQQTQQISSFGPFSFNHEARLLFLRGETVPLSPKALDILSVLIESHGELVKKDELVEAVWPNTFVEESNLAHHISVLRKTLGQGTAGQQYIETVPKRGYRFIASLNSAKLEPSMSRERASGSSMDAGELRRLVVLPFLQLRADDESKFLCYALPDAIGCALAGLQPLLIRSSRAAARFAGPSIDVRAVAAELDVDAVMTGTLLRAGKYIRVSTQLLDAASRTLVWSYNTQVNIHDIFQVQDELVQRIVASLAVPLTRRDRRLLRQKAPANARAYEFFLKANDVSQTMHDLKVARDLYLHALEEDPRYAPAWARLARCYRVLAKYGSDPAENILRAQEAFDHAFILSPDLPSIHGLYAQHEAEQGRASQALFRVLSRISESPYDPELYAATVQVARYNGLLNESLQAHAAARRLDPTITTSVLNTHFAMGEYELVLAATSDQVGYVNAMALDALGRREEALECLHRGQDGSLPPMMCVVIEMLKAYLQDRRLEAVERLRKLNEQGVDPEGFFFRARLFARLDETADAVDTLDQAVRKGFACAPAFRGDSFLDALRGEAGFRCVVDRADRISARARALVTDAGGWLSPVSPGGMPSLRDPSQF